MLNGKVRLIGKYIVNKKKNRVDERYILRKHLDRQLPRQTRKTVKVYFSSTVTSAVRNRNSKRYPFSRQPRHNTIDIVLLSTKRILYGTYLVDQPLGRQY